MKRGVEINKGMTLIAAPIIAITNIGGTGRRGTEEK